MIKTKVKKVKSIDDPNGDLADMFNQMLGAGDLNIDIAYARYLRVKEICEKIIKVLTFITSSPFMLFNTDPAIVIAKNQLQNFIDSAQIKLDTLFSCNLDSYQFDFSKLPDLDKSVFAQIYNKMRQNELIKIFITMYNDLDAYKNNFSDPNQLNDIFIRQIAGIEWKPFHFTSLDLKYIFNMDGVGTNTVEFFMNILYKCFTLSKDLNHEIMSPDIDVDKFVHIIVSSIENVQKKPELSRCRKAFDKIKNSVQLLKDRFNTYYRDFIVSGDSTIIMQHFILDISKTTSTDVETNQQFMTILNYYKKIAQTQISNPKIQMLFDKVNDSFNFLEKKENNVEIIEPKNAN